MNHLNFDWSLLDPCFKYIAMDADGWWYAYSTEPVSQDGRWALSYIDNMNGEYLWLADMGINLDPVDNWKDSLTERPEQVDLHPTVKFVKAYLEGKSIECSEDGGKTWKPYATLDLGSGCFSVPGFLDMYTYRVKPDNPKRKIGDEYVPAPETLAPKDGALYWIPTISSPWGYSTSSIWTRTGEDWELLERGFVFLEEEHANANAKAILNLLGANHKLIKY